MRFYEFECTEDRSAVGGVCRGIGDGGNPPRWQGRLALILLAALAGSAAAQTRIDIRTQSKNVDFSGASSTKPSKTGTVLPATCGVGETFLKTDAPAGQNLYVCATANTWTVQGTPGAAGNVDKVLSNDGTSAGWRAMGGDVSGRPDALTVTKLQGQPVSATAPAGGQLLIWNASAGLWQPANLAFTAISGTVADAQVGTGINANKIGGGSVSNTIFGYLANVTADVQAQLNGKATTNQAIAGDVSGNLGATKVNALQGRNVTSAAPSNGQALVWNAATSQWEPQTPGAAIASVFGRTGAITAQSGDYSFSQIGGTIADAQVGTGINATKIGGGLVGNTAFGYLANVTSDLQTQLNNKAALVHSHNAGGDAGGDIGSMTVTALRNRTVASTAPANGQALVWNASVSQWQPQNQTGAVSGVFGRTGSVTAQSGDYSFGQISGTVTDSQVGTGINANKVGSGAVGNTAFGYLANVSSDLQTQLNGKSAVGHSHNAGGDASGDIGSMTVTALRNRSVSTAAPVNGQALTWNSTTMQWEPQSSSGAVTSVFGRTGIVTGQTGDYSFSQLSGTVTDAQVATGINATKIGGGLVGNTAFSYLANVSSDVQGQLNGKSPVAHSHTDYGDVTGDLGSTKVVALQNRAVASTAPANGQALVWNSVAAQWQPQNQSGGVSSAFGRTGAVTAQSGDYSFGQISGTVTDAQVGTGINATKIGSGTVANTAFGYLANVTSDVQAQLNGKAATNQTLAGDVGGNLTAAKVTGLQNRAVAATAPANGQTLTWNSTAMQWEPQSSTGTVSSVFGRIGSVTAQTGDYTFAQIGGTVADAQVGSGVNANKIGGGTVGNTAFGYLANVTSDIQAQLNGKAALSHSHTAAGDASGDLGSLKVTALQNWNVASTIPANGQALVWNSAASQWQPQNQTGATASVFGRTGAVTAQSGDYTFGQISGTVTDSQVSTGISANKIGGGTVGNTAFGYLANVTSDLQGQLNGKAATTQLLTGDVSGNLTSTKVTGLQNRNVGTAAPAGGQALVWNASSMQWEPSGVVASAFGRAGAVTAQTGDYSFPQIGGTVSDSQVATGINATKIGSGTVGNTAFGYLANVTSDLQTQLNGKASTSQPVAGDVSGGLNSMTVTALQNRAVASAAPSNGQVLGWNSSLSQWQPQNGSGGVPSVFGRSGAVTAQNGDYSFSQISGSVNDSQVSTGINANKIGSGAVGNTAFGYLANVTSDLQAQLNAKVGTNQSVAGDVSGNPGALTVTALQNRAVATTVPTNGQVLAWNSSASQWQPQTGSGSVPSVFGRTGPIAAQIGDYSFSQISGTVGDSQVATGINATKIGSGTVTNTALGYLSNATSDIQAQLNGKASANQPVGGDVSGTLSTLTVAALQNRAVANTAPTNGQALVWNASSSQWQPQTVTPPTGAYSSSFTSQTTVTITGAMHQLGTANLLVGCYDNSVPAMRIQPNTVSVHPTLYDVTVTFSTAQTGRCVLSAGGSGTAGSGGASMASQLGDFNASYTTPTMLTIGSNCSTSTPCNVRLGARVFSFTTSETVSLTAGTGTAYFFVDANGNLTAGHNLTLACAAPCIAASGVTAFPLNSVPLFTWTATSGTWDAAGGSDKRAVLSGKILNAGVGIMTLDTTSSTSIAVDSATVPTYLAASATLSFAAIANGTCAADATFPLQGAIAGNSVAPGLPGSLEPGLVATMRVSAANTIAVRLCNLSGATVTPAAATYTGTIVRSF